MPTIDDMVSKIMDTINDGIPSDNKKRKQPPTMDLKDLLDNSRKFK